jgi:hypothetical protein
MEMLAFLCAQSHEEFFIGTPLADMIRLRHYCADESESSNPFKFVEANH